MGPEAGAALTLLERIIFVLLLISTLGTAFVTFRRRYVLVRSGKPPAAPGDTPGERLRRWLLYVPGQWCNLGNLTRGNPAGILHVFLFWGVLVFFLYYFLFVFLGDALGFSRMIRTGSFSLAFLRVSDIMGVLLIIALIWGLARRMLLRPGRLGPHFELTAFTLITLLGFILMLCYFFIEGLRLNLGMIEHAGPVSQFFADVIRKSLGGAEEQLGIFHILWWVQALVLVSVIIYIPHSGHQHALFAPLNILYGSPHAMGRLSPVELDETYRGLSAIRDFKQKQLLEFYACTQCGRCQDACPAYDTMKRLSPKKVIQDLRVWMDGAGGIRFPWPVDVEKQKLSVMKAWESISDETLWACTTCMACQNACPAFISPLDKIIDLRRDRVLMKGAFYPEVNNLFRDVETYGDTFGKGKALREDWALGLNAKVLSSENETEVLLWVGCQGSFHDRVKMIVAALALLMKRSGIDFAVLGKGEVCCGDPARRIGNEYLFHDLARKNIENLQSLHFKRIVTYCPHCFNMLKNEYPRLGGRFEVLHYTEWVCEMLTKGTLEIKKSLPADIVYHDPCYLARGNGLWQKPREILSSVPGVTLLETEHSRMDTFCCGGGGGHMWMRETGKVKINETRVRQLVANDPEAVVTSCPYCLVMLEDGLKSLGLETVTCRDIVEILRDTV